MHPSLSEEMFLSNDRAEKMTKAVQLLFFSNLYRVHIDTLKSPCRYKWILGLDV